MTMLIHHQRQESGRELPGGDPVTRMPVELSRSVSPRRPFHVAVTATDAPYSRWQCRIMYYWYKKMKEKEGSEMGGFTRVLHSGKPDSLMDEIPTFVVDPLPNGADRVRLFSRSILSLYFSFLHQSACNRNMFQKKFTRIIHSRLSLSVLFDWFASEVTKSSTCRTICEFQQ